MSQPRRATVWWLDAHKSPDWLVNHEDAIKEHSPVLLGVVGWVLQDDDIGITLGWEIKDMTGRNDHVKSIADYRGTKFVPRGMIERVEYLEPQFALHTTDVTGNGAVNPVTMAQ